MKQKIIITLLIFISASLGIAFFSFKNDKAYFITSGCDLISSEKREMIYRLNYQYCHFMDDGSLLAYSAGDRKVYHFDKNYNTLWSVVQLSHHEFFVDEENQRLYTFGSANHDYLNRLTRFDTIQVTDILTGKLLKTWDSFSQKEELLAAGFDRTYIALTSEQQTFFQNPPYATEEFTHFNSIQPIPANDVEQENPWFKKGNFLISLNTEKVIGIYNYDQNKITGYIKQEELKKIKNAGIHDVRFFDRESIYYYRNTSPIRDEYVQIVRLNLKTKKREILFTTNFTANLYGGMDKTHDGNMLISHNENGAKIVKVDFKSHKLLWIYDYGDKKSEIYRPRELELSSFLKNNHFLNPVMN